MFLKKTQRRAFLKRPEAAWGLFNEKGALIGYLFIYFYKYTARLYSIGIAPEYQGQGLGKKLMEFYISLSKERGYKFLSLEVNTDNLRAINLYKSFGFEVTQTLKDYYEEGVHAYRMKRKI